MADEGNKSNLEKTREYAKSEWLKYHPEDKDKDFSNISSDYALPHNKGQKRSSESIFNAAAGVVSALVVAGLWIAVFCKEDIGVFVLPLFTALMFVFSWLYMSGSKEFDKICLFFVIFYVVNLITSIVAWFSSDSNVSFIAISNTILSGLMFRFMTKNW
jgi:hypothetical protein